MRDVPPTSLTVSRAHPARHNARGARELISGSMGGASTCAMTREAPLASLFAAFLFGVAIG